MSKSSHTPNRNTAAGIIGMNYSLSVFIPATSPNKTE